MPSDTLPSSASGSLDAARAAKVHAREAFEKIAPVCGVGITRIDKAYGLKINLTEPPSGEVELPTEIDGVPVKVEITGTIRAR